MHPFVLILLFVLYQCSQALVPDAGAWKAPCGFAWGENTQCKNFVQGAVLGPSFFLAGRSMHILFNCMSQDTQEKCTNYKKESKDESCDWCAISSNYKSHFGNGSCLSKVLNVGNMGCYGMESMNFVPLVNLMEKYKNITVPTGPQQAQCLLHNKDKKTCEGQKHGGFECGYYELPRLYGWQPYSAICFQKNLMGDEHWGIRAALADLPDEANDRWVDAFISKTATSSPEMIMSRIDTMAQYTTTRTSFYTKKNKCDCFGIISAVLVTMLCFL